MVENISKRFPGVKALDNVSFRITSGEIVGLVGENGAGKSTLIKILAGVYTNYSGTIYVSNKKVNFTSPTDAQDNGIATIFQELTIIPELSVAENIVLGREPLKAKIFLNKSVIYKKSKEALKFLSSSIDPHEKAGNLSIANQQIVEICKALVLDAKVIIMDEPTSSLTKIEVNQLFKVIKKLKKDGKSILYVSHRIEEIFEICDSIKVLRDGKLVNSEKKRSASPNNVVKMMVGRSIKNIYPFIKTHAGKIVLSVKNLIKDGEFKDVSFNIREGEIVGFAGLVGAGRTEVAKAIIGITHPDGGTIQVFGKKLKNFSHPRKALNAGLAYLPENRKEDGIFPMLTIKENISLSSLKLCTKLGIFNQKKESNLVNKYINDIRIKTTGQDQVMETLSGGNQQKVIISRLLATKSKIFIFDESTHGIDIGAKYEIYNIIKALVAENKAIIFISSELPELIGIADRILLMRRGELVKEYNKDEANAENIMQVLTRE